MNRKRRCGRMADMNCQSEMEREFGKLKQEMRDAIVARFGLPEHCMGTTTRYKEPEIVRVINEYGIGLWMICAEEEMLRIMSEQFCRWWNRCEIARTINEMATNRRDECLLLESFVKSAGR